MPRIERDTSKDPAVEYASGWHRITATVIDNICAEFQIKSREAFGAQLRLASGAYWSNRAATSDLPTVRQLSEHLERIQLANARLVEELRTIGPMLERWLSNVPRDSASQLSCSLPNLTNYLFVRTLPTGNYHLDVAALLAGLELLGSSAQASIGHAENLVNGRLPGELAGHRVTRSPASHMPGTVLLSNAREFYLLYVGKKFGRGFVDEEDEDLNRIRVPNNQASRFVAAVCNAIDPSLSGDQIEKLMAACIKKFRARERMPFPG